MRKDTGKLYKFKNFKVRKVADKKTMTGQGTANTKLIDVKKLTLNRKLDNDMETDNYENGTMTANSLNKPQTQ